MIIKRLFSTKYAFKYSQYMLPRMDKKEKGGQDAILALENVLVVADGVGGWADQGIDPGLFSKQLITNIKQQLILSKEYYIEKPKKLFISAVYQTKNLGSSTLSILTLH